MMDPADDFNDSERAWVGVFQRASVITIELSTEELSLIESWYHSAAGESASGMSCPLREEITTQAAFDKYYKWMVEAKALVDKLGFTYHGGDEYHLRQHGLIPAEAAK